MLPLVLAMTSIGLANAAPASMSSPGDTYSNAPESKQFRATAEAEAPDVTPFLKEYNNSYSMEYVSPYDSMWYEYSFNSEEAGEGTFFITAGDEPGTIVIPDFVYGTPGYHNVGKVDMEARTITFEPQSVYTDTDGWDYCLLKVPAGLNEAASDGGSVYVFLADAEPVVATFDEQYNITFNDWTYGWNYEPYWPDYGIYVYYRNTSAYFTNLNIGTSVDSMSVAGDGQVRYYDLQGREVRSNGQLSSGIYIRVQDGKSTKILVK